MQQASAGLLATILGLPAPNLKIKVEDSPASQEEITINTSKDPTINTSKDPIFALQEYCQAKNFPCQLIPLRWKAQPTGQSSPVPVLLAPRPAPARQEKSKGPKG